MSDARLVIPRGQGDALATWLRQARTLSLPHAMIVEGARGVGKSTIMRWLAAALLCPSDLDQEGPCGVCRTCARIASGQHPDLLVLDRAQDEKDRKSNDKSFYVIKVDQVRKAQEVLQRHAVEGGARVLIIDDADCTEEGAQNALLKTLEEPGENTFLLLEATRPERLAETVRSRAQRLRVLPLTDAALLRELQKNFPVSSGHERAVQVASGSLGQAQAALTEHAVQLHDLVQAMLGSAKGLRPIVTARAVLEGQKDRRSEIEAARMFLWLLRAELRQRAQRVAAAADPVYGAGATEPWTTWLELTLAAEQDLDLMIPPEQALAACLLECEARR
ncbi:MAG: AAA family ATPase [bacterium]|nr:AAA family ATPase [bacterium]